MHRVIPGVSEPLSKIPGHLGVAGIERIALMKAGMVPGVSFHVAVHIVSSEMAAARDFRYMEPHAHDYDEISILLSEHSTLTYLFEVDGERFEVSSPSTVFIPAGSLHRMEAIRGEGSFLCIRLDAETGKKDG